MAVAYLYSWVSPMSPETLAAKIEANTGLVPSLTQMVSTWAYIEFPAALSGADKAALDEYMANLNGVFAATDLAPSRGIMAVGVSEDDTVWKQIIDNTGVLTTERVE